MNCPRRFLWSKNRLEKIVIAFGFDVLEIKQTTYKRTFNVEIICKKNKSISYEESIKAARHYLSDYMVDDSETEKNMLDIWCHNFETQLNKSFAK